MSIRPSRKRLCTRIGRALACAMLAACLYACNAPFIPPPPPGNPIFTGVAISDGNGGERRMWEARGGSLDAASDGRFFLFNRTLGTGVIAQARADGSYVAPPLDGQLGDAIEVSYETDKGDPSETICRKLVEGTAESSCE